MVHELTREMPPLREEPSLGDLFAELSRETTTLVRQEVALAKAEMSQKASRIGRDVAFLAAGGVLAYAGLLTMIAVLVLVFAQAIPPWAAALLVGVLVTAGGGFLVMKGLTALKQEDMTPRQTIETLKEDAAWAKEQTK